MKIEDEDSPKIITCELSMYALILERNPIMVIVRGIYICIITEYSSPEEPLYI